MKRLLLAALAATALAPSLLAQDRLTPPKQRITDEAVAKDLALLRRWRARARALPESGPAAIYAREKALGWIAFAFDEYTDNDRTAVVDSAFSEAQRLVIAAEAGQAAAPGTPLVPGTARVLPEVGAQLQRLAESPQTLACAPREIAQGEVALLRAGHEGVDGAACRSEPHREATERLAREAAAKAAACEPPADTTVQAVPAPEPLVPVTEPLPEEVLEVPNVVHFAFDKSGLIAESRAVLDTIAAALVQLGGRARIEVIGHTDLRGTREYNVGLSRRRATSVRNYLLSKGVSAEQLELAPLGKSRPRVLGARSKVEHARNRRVELQVDVAPPPRLVLREQEGDLQPDK